MMRRRQVALARGRSLDQISQPRKSLKAAINRHFGVNRGSGRTAAGGAASMASVSWDRSYVGGLPSRSCAAAKAGGLAWIQTRIKSDALLSRRHAFRHRATAVIADH